MSLRYGRLFDTTVCAEYERALDLAKQQARTTATGRAALPLADITGGANWKDTPLIKSRLAGGMCLRAPAQGACTYSTAPASTPRQASCPSWPPSAPTPGPKLERFLLGLAYLAITDPAAYR